ncbi:MAG: hypothetical protein Q9Q13_06380 [Acidobacteriota bacterium]|nr:hypothetical protein [Acidobacteriota bacterium]
MLLVDYGLLGPQPEEALVRLRRPPDPPIIIVIAPPGDPSPAYTLLEAGAHDVVHSPAHPLELRLRVGRLLEARDLGAHLASLEDAITERSRRSFKARTVVAHSAAMRKLQETLDRVARLRTTVLIRGGERGRQGTRLPQSAFPFTAGPGSLRRHQLRRAAAAPDRNRALRS